jgi:hypothetical protein
MRACRGLLTLVVCALSLDAQDQPELLYPGTSGLLVEQNGTDFWLRLAMGNA